MWTDVLLNKYIDLDHIFPGHYALEPVAHHTQTVGSLDITLNNMSGPSHPSKTIHMHSDWLLTFEVAKEAVLFAYPHRAREFFGYQKFIISMSRMVHSIPTQGLSHKTRHHP